MHAAGSWPSVRVLAVGAHPDDVELGAGATLAKHAAAGSEVFILVLGTGALSRKGASAADVAELKGQCMESAAILGAQAHVLAFPDQQFDTVSLLEIIRAVEEVLKVTQADVVYTHHAGDLNIDHRLTSLAVRTACRPAGKRAPDLFAFEVPSSTEWGEPLRPSLFVDVTGEPLTKKMAALTCFAGEMRSLPHPRSPDAIAALARWRGATAGVETAEAFEVLREIR